MCWWQRRSWCSCSIHLYSSMDKGSKLLHCRWLEAMVCKWPSRRVSLKLQYDYDNINFLLSFETNLSRFD